jgi:hypothetical protein
MSGGTAITFFRAPSFSRALYKPFLRSTDPNTLFSEPELKYIILIFVNKFSNWCPVTFYTPLYALNPPSTGITTPVTNLDKSEIR